VDTQADSMSSFICAALRNVELRAEDLADEMIEIADDPCVWVEKIGADGRAVRVLDHENLARVRLRMKALERQAARMAR
jgi:hypothetical protein